MSETFINNVKQFWNTDFSFGNIHFKPANYAFELGAIIVLFLYIAWNTLMHRNAQVKALNWWKIHKAFLDSQFSRVGAQVENGLWEENAYKYIGYATGRRGLKSLTVTINSSFISDPLRWIAERFWEVADPNHLKQEDSILLDFLMLAPKGTPGAKFVFSTSTTSYAKPLRSRRWDIQRFTNIIEAKKLTQGLVVSSESGEVLDLFTKDPQKSKAGFFERFGVDGSFKGSLVDDIRNPFGSVFQYLTISDMPGVDPDVTTDDPDEPIFLPKEAEWRFIIRLNYDKSSKNPDLTHDILDFALNLVDFLYEKHQLLPSFTIDKFRKKRLTIENEIRAELRKDSESDQKKTTTATKTKLSKKEKKDKKKKF